MNHKEVKIKFGYKFSDNQHIMDNVIAEMILNIKKQFINKN